MLRVLAPMVWPLLFVGCAPLCLPCISGQMRTSPIYVDPVAFCRLQRQADGLNHRFAPYETAMDHCRFPRRVCQRLIWIDGALQHVNAELISREVPPWKIERQLGAVAQNLEWVEACIGVIPPMERCRKHRD